jgi:CRISPR-associated endonuclease Cas1
MPTVISSRQALTTVGGISSVAAKPNVLHSSAVSQIPKSGVLVLFGFGIRVSMQSGHLCIEDGIGPERRHFRLPRVAHGLQRLIVIGSDGFVTLAALRWLADQKAAFVMLERDGTVLITTGPVRPSDARLRRAQALAEHSGAALCIAKELIGRKLAAQVRVVRDKLLDPKTAEIVALIKTDVDRAETMEAVRWLESRGAALYWSVWRNLPICFPLRDLPRTPDHWKAFDTRKSVLTGSQRLATNPVNACLNYLFSVLESESRLAAAALGLDPGLGFIHLDTPARDSLACDLMEPVRPQVEGWLLDWITREPLNRNWFFEERNGNCRLMAPFAVRLAETAPMWARAVAPVAEWVARQLWSRRRDSRETGPATRLTQNRKREVKGSLSLPRPEATVKPQRLCRDCGKEIDARYSHCLQCATPTATERLRRVAHAGRIASHTPEAQRKQGNTQRRHRQAEASWSPGSQPDWLTEEFFAKEVQPKLAAASTSLIVSQLGVSAGYAGQIRKGYRPHPRHWLALAELARIT